MIRCLFDLGLFFIVIILELDIEILFVVGNLWLVLRYLMLLEED